MVRRAERARPADAPFFEDSGHRLHHADFQRLCRGQFGQYAGKAARHQRFAGSRRADHQQIVPARRRDLQGALGGFLSLHLLEIGEGRGLFHQPTIRLGKLGRTFEMVEQADEVGCGKDGHIACPFCLRPLRCGTDEALLRLACMERCQQDAGRRRDAPIEGQFAHHDPVLQLLGIGDPHRREHGERHGQVVMRAFLGQVGRREIDRDPFWRQREAHRCKRRAHALLAFADRLVGQAHDIEVRKARREGALHLHAARLQPEIGHRPDQCDHA